jgi:predicted ATPase
LRRFILTGAPGAGKTTVARLLAEAGHTVIGETATEVIEAAQATGDDLPWRRPEFCEEIAAAQRDRQLAANALPGPIQYFDRSPVCTLALARYTGQPVGPVLAAELDRIKAEAVYEPRVLMFDLLGFITRTKARHVTLEEAQDFEQYHLDAYTEHGFTIERIRAAVPEDRASLITRLTTGPADA